MTDKVKEAPESTAVDTLEPVEDAVKTAVKSGKKKTRRSVPYAQVHVQASFNNTIITVADKQGNVISSSSAGACGFRGSKKGTAYAAQVASEKALQKAKSDYGVSKVDIYVGGVGLGRESAIRALQSVDMVVETITDVTPRAHGGVRPKNPRKG